MSFNRQIISLVKNKIGIIWFTHYITGQITGVKSEQGSQIKQNLSGIIQHIILVVIIPQSHRNKFTVKQRLIILHYMQVYLSSLITNCTNPLQLIFV
jgi:hypothetical protein